MVRKRLPWREKGRVTVRSFVRLLVQSFVRSFVVVKKKENDNGREKMMTRGRRSKNRGRAKKSLYSQIGVWNRVCPNCPMRQVLFSKRRSEVYWLCCWAKLLMVAMINFRLLKNFRSFWFRCSFGSWTSNALPWDQPSKYILHGLWDNLAKSMTTATRGGGVNGWANRNANFPACHYQKKKVARSKRSLRWLSPYLSFVFFPCIMTAFFFINVLVCMERSDMDFYEDKVTGMSRSGYLSNKQKSTLTDHER
jgi:hypothetical protein